MSKNKNNPSIRAPVPQRTSISGIRLGSSTNLSRGHFQASLSPSTSISRVATPLTPSPNPIEQIRLEHFNLDYPNTTEVEEVYDKQSRFYGRAKRRMLQLHQYLPYETEIPLDQSRYLSHIVTYLYIAINSLDIGGTLSVSPKDIEKLRDAGHLGPEPEDFDPEFSENETDDGSDESEEESDSEEEEEEEDEYADDLSGEISSGIASAASNSGSRNSSIVVSVRHWTHELRTWIKMGNVMPFELTAALAKVYYSLCFVRGQPVPVPIYAQMLELLTSYRPDILKEKGLVLDYRPLYENFEKKFPQGDTLYDLPPGGPSRKYLLRIAFAAYHFFPENEFDEVFSKLGSKISLITASLSLGSLHALLPMNSKRLPQVIPAMFSVWSLFSKVKACDTHLTAFFGSTYEHLLAKTPKKESPELGKFGFLSKEQLLFVLSTLQNSLNIQPRKFGLSASSNIYFGYATIIMFNINGEQALEPEDGLFKHVDTLLNTIETYLHPSNTDSWTSSCTKFVLELVLQFHRRYIYENNPEKKLHGLAGEHKLSDKVIEKFVAILLPRVVLGLQSKVTSVVDSNVESLELLCKLHPKQVLNAILLDTYESLQSIVSNHRMTVALKILSRLSRYFVTEKIFRCHVTTLLGLVIPGIDSNDLDKTLLTLNVISSFACYLPFYTLPGNNSGLAFEVTQNHLQFLTEKVYDKDYSGKEYFELDDELEVQAVESSSLLFETFIDSFIFRVLSLLENIPNQSNTQSTSEVSLETSLPRALFLIYEACSDKFFDKFSDKFYQFVNENNLFNSVLLVAYIISGLVKHDAKTQTSKFMDLMLDKINEQLKHDNAGKVRSGTEVLHRDKPLYCYTTILLTMIRYTGENILAYSFKLTHLSRLLLRDIKGPIMYPAAFIVPQALKSLTTIYISEARLISPDYVAQYGITADCWGGFYDDPRRFEPENLKFKWHVPEKKEIEFAVQFFGEHINECFKNLDSLMQNAVDKEEEENNLLDFSDNFKKNLLYISDATSGIAYLLDPEYQEKFTDGSPKKLTQLLNTRLRLLNLSQRSLLGLNVGGDETPLVGMSGISTPRVDDGEVHEQEEVALSRNESTTSLDNLARAGSSSSLSSLNNGASNGELELELGKPGDGDATPGVGGLMNPSITSRAQKLYTCNYFFGNTREQRQKNDLYKKIHGLHKKVGEKLHEIFLFLIAKYPNDVKLFKRFLHSTQIWFCDYGSEQTLKSFDDSLVTYKYLKGIQFTEGIDDPYTRVALGAKIERYHRQRVVIHAGSRFLTKLDKSLLNDIIQLSMSIYSGIADAALDSLNGSMKKVMGSYGVLVNTLFTELEAVIKENDYKRIQSALNVFMISRLKTRIHGDYKNLKKYANFLLQCMNADHQATNDLARALYHQFGLLVKIPTSVCIIDLESINVIRPPDTIVGLDIKLLRSAKEKKRIAYLENLKDLQKLVLANETSKENSWKISVSNMNLLIHLQNDYEIATNTEILQLLFTRSLSAHPDISQAGLVGIYDMFGKLQDLSSYGYNLRNIADINYLPSEIEYVNTDFKSLKHNFMEDFSNELKKKDDFEYFIDDKICDGWLFWDKKLRVIKNVPQTELYLNKHDSHMINIVGNMMTKKWLETIVNNMVESNDEQSKFQGNHVYFLVKLVCFVCSSKVTGISYQDIIDVLTAAYVRDEKSSHVVICEMLCGLLIASKYTDAESLKIRDEFVASTLNKVFADLSPDNNHVWKIFSWWIPYHTDVRRYLKPLAGLISYRPIPGVESPFIQATRLSCLKSFITSMSWRYRDADLLIKDLLELILHPYQAVRDQIATTFTTALYCYFNASFPDSLTFIESNKEAGPLGLAPYRLPKHVLGYVTEAFEAVAYFKNQIKPSDSVQDILNSPYIYGARTLVVMVKVLAKASVGVGIVEIFSSHISPFLLNLENMRDTCKLANIDPSSIYRGLAQLPYRNEHIAGIVDVILANGGIASPSWHQLLLIVSFTEIFYFRQLLLLSSQQNESLFTYMSGLMFSSHLEVREAAAGALSGMIHCSPTKDQGTIIPKYIGSFGETIKKFKLIPKKKRKTLTTADKNKLHGATLGLGALVTAFPYKSPPPSWFPEVLELLSNNAFGISGGVDKASKGVLSSFKKTRQDTWHIDSKIFSEDQLQDLEGVIRESYFV